MTAVAASVTVSETALAVPEGSSATYSVALTVKPGGEVTVAVALTGDSDLTASPTSLTFTTDNWSTARTVTVSAAADADGANGEAEIAHTVSGGGYDGKSVASVTAREVDDDPGVRVSPPTLSVPETGSAPYTVVLQSAPGGAVTVTLALSGDSDLTASATALTFTTDNWSTAQTVTVSAADDADAENGTATIAHTASGGGYAGVAVASVMLSEADDDVVGVSLSAPTLSVPEQGTASYTVVLDSEPAAAVTVTPTATGDSDISVSGTLTFTTDDWSTAQTVTVSAADDGDTAHGVATIAHAAVSTDGDYDGIDIADVTATEADDDSAGLEISKSALTVAEGGTDTYTVRLASEPTATVVKVRGDAQRRPGSGCESARIDLHAGGLVDGADGDGVGGGGRRRGGRRGDLHAHGAGRRLHRGRRHGGGDGARERRGADDALPERADDVGGRHRELHGGARLEAECGGDGERERRRRQRRDGVPDDADLHAGGLGPGGVGDGESGARPGWG